MSDAYWRDAVIDYIRAEALPVDKFGHQPRLYALALDLGEGMEYDDDVVFAAAWMHDLGVFLNHRPKDPEFLARWDHVPYTIAKTKELLIGWEFPAPKLNAVAETIRTHQAHDHPTQVEGILLRDADILEQLGAMGALRALVKVGRDTRYPTFSSVLPLLHRAVDNLPGRLRLTKAKDLAVERVAVLKGLISAIEAEAGKFLF